MITLWHGDCLQRMGDIPSGSVDMILADLPYGSTRCVWDTVIPFPPLWEHYKRVIKRNGAIVLFGSQPFTSALVMSNPAMFRYCWVWRKSKPNGFLDAKRKPMKAHEDIAVFSHVSPIYYPQGLRLATHPGKSTGGERVYGKVIANYRQEVTYTGYPCSVLDYPSIATQYHPTQKPVALLEYLVQTYTNEGETVLDNCAGSFSTGVACVNTDRSFIGIEKYPLLDRPIDPRTNPNYFFEGQARIEDSQSQARQLSLAV